MVARYIFPVLAAITTVYADCTVTAATTASHPTDIAAIATCKTFSGDIVIQTGAANAGIINLDGVKQIDGKITYNNDSTVQTFQATQLQKVGGLSMDTLNGLSALTLPALRTVGNFSLTTLPALSTVNFGDGLETAGSVVLIDTGLGNLDGFTTISQLDSFSCSDNTQLGSIKLDIDAVPGTIEIGSNDVNNGGLTVSFPNLVRGGVMNFRNASSVSLPALEVASEALGLYFNLFQSFSAPNVTTLGSLFIIGNAKLTNTTFPNLVNINGTGASLVIANNTALSSISGLPKLQSINGDLDLFGNFTKVDLPSLKTIAGAVNVQTSATNFDCTNINNLGSGVARGQVVCAAAQSNPGMGSTPTGSGSGSSPSSSGAAVPMGVPSAIGGTGLVAMLLSLLL